MHPVLERLGLGLVPLNDGPGDRHTTKQYGFETLSTISCFTHLRSFTIHAPHPLQLTEEQLDIFERERVHETGLRRAIEELENLRRQFEGMHTNAVRQSIFDFTIQSAHSTIIFLHHKYRKERTKTIPLHADQMTGASEWDPLLFSICSVGIEDSLFTFLAVEPQM